MLPYLGIAIEYSHSCMTELNYFEENWVGKSESGLTGILSSAHDVTASGAREKGVGERDSAKSLTRGQWPY